MRTRAKQLMEVVLDAIAYELETGSPLSMEDIEEGLLAALNHYENEAMLFAAKDDER